MSNVTCLCEDCGFLTSRMIKECPRCGSDYIFTDRDTSDEPLPELEPEPAYD